MLLVLPVAAAAVVPSMTLECEVAPPPCSLSPATPMACPHLPPPPPACWGSTDADTVCLQSRLIANWLLMGLTALCEGPISFQSKHFVPSGVCI